MKQFRFHVVGLPHTQTSKVHSACAFTIKILRFIRMMASLGHKVYHYGAEGSEVSEWAEDVPVLSRKEQEGWFGPFDPNKLYNADWTGAAPYWKLLNERSVTEIIQRKQHGDFVCVIMGRLCKPIADAVGTDVRTVEYGIGYNGPFAKYRVFESYAHMHKIWGIEGGYDPNGKFYDCVIGNYLDEEEYPFGAVKQDYFLYLGRLVQRKGVGIAVETCRHIGAKLVIAGQGCTKVDYVDGVQQIHCEDGAIYSGNHLKFVGPVIGEKRAELFKNAKAVFLPTWYIEPFGTVAVEAQMAGTPAITTDFGVFPETVEHGKTGFRCRTMDHFVWAAKHVGDLDPNYIHQRAVANWSMDRIKWKYQEYFEMLDDLWRGGWNEVHEDRSNLDWLRQYP